MIRDLYSVKEIIGKRYNPIKKCGQYLIEWNGYEDRTWQPRNHLQFIEDYLRQVQSGLKDIEYNERDDNIIDLSQMDSNLLISAEQQRHLIDNQHAQHSQSQFIQLLHPQRQHQNIGQHQNISAFLLQEQAQMLPEEVETQRQWQQG